MAAKVKREQVLVMIPADQITFKPPFDSVSDSSLKLNNPTERNVAFKIKTTAPQRYCVRPNAGTIHPNGDAEIKVMLQPGQTDEKHKFMVQSIFVPDDYNKLETKEEKKEFVAELWKSPAENPVMSSKLLCNFLKPDEQPKIQQNVEPKEIPKQSPTRPVVQEAPVVEEKLYQHNQTVEAPKKVQVKQDSRPSSSTTEDQSEEIRRLRQQLRDATKQIEILSSTPPQSQEQTPEQQKLFLVLLFVAFIAGFVLSCLV